KRANSKQDKNTILRDALGSYARYGASSPFTWRLSEKELLTLQSEELIDRIKSLTCYEHKVYYYGQAPKSEVADLLKRYHEIPAQLKPVIAAKKFEQQATPARVLFLDYPIVQSDVMMVSKGTPQFNLEEYYMTELYNNYFGYGLSSIVFQDIREAKALAYSTYAYYSSPNKAEKAHYLQAYVGTQPDKLPDAIPALLNILEDMPVVPQQIRHAQDSILKRMESARVSPRHYYWRLRSMEFLGVEDDLRKESYERLKKVGPEDLVRFQQQYVKGRDFTFVVLGSKDRVDLSYLSQFGPIEEVSLEQIFGF
ncbi:MAG: insulinase family protein, partial [Bacteroidota bacterium]